MNALSFSIEQFNKLFPFYFILNEKNRITSVGKGLSKLLSFPSDQPFFEAFYLERPRQVCDQNTLSNLTNQSVIIRSTMKPDVRLRGQFELMKPNELLFVGTPWFNSVDEVVKHDLAITDFAYHDPLIDLLHVMKSQDIATQEIKSLLEKINDQKNRLNNDQLKLKDREYQLLQSEKRFSSLIMNLQTGVLLEDENRKIVLCNTMFCNLFGIPVAPKDLEGMDCSNAAEDNKPMFKNPEEFVVRINETLAERKLVLGELLELADGRTYLRDYIPIFVSDEYKGHLWKYTDVTQRFNYERKLKAQEEKYRGIIENMKLGLIEVNLQDEIQFANETFCELGGYSREELIGKQAAELFAPAKAKSIVEEKAALRKRGVSDSYEIQVRDKSNQPRWWFISGAPNYNDAGELIGSVGIHLDITEQKSLEEALLIAKNKAEESSRAKESFLANMSHEIRTPLNAIIGMVRQLKRTDLTAQQGKCLHYADSASQHLLSIVNNILDISKIEAGEFRIDSQPFDLRTVLSDVGAIMQPAAIEKMLQFNMNIDPRLADMLTGDASHLRQVLINILGNAVKFTIRGSIDVHCAVVSASTASQVVRIDIHDTGVGMEPEFLLNIFNKFSQEDDSAVRKFGGTGLGMAITHQLVQLMHGTIEVESEKEKGSRFTLTFEWPIAEAIAEIVVQDNEALQENLRILVVEDNELNRMVARHCLSYHQCEIAEAVNGAEAIIMLKNNAYDMILMDLHMPEMDGITATTVIRKQLRLDVPIIALTANAFQAEIDKCLAAGMNSYVTKPFDEKDLIKQIKQTLKSSRMLHNMSKPAPVVTPMHKLYNLSKLEQLSHGDRQFLKKILTIFCTDVPAMLNQIQNSVQKSDVATLRSVSHQMKPTLENLGIDTLYEVIRTLEKTTNVNSETVHLSEKLNDVLLEVMTDVRATVLA
ncbi:MAG TPA: response regulator [Cyclobacteriaceae bacterium]|nr:response regulator [Cyclobacteriaceae bacterium]HMV10987.1 response regulator [Cyclobacteriaceae bacterium]HMV91038.1 response regulator [Cyclobacteriaceae bacterium]HMX01848.1 response regulator [Cyclobacteriaceae bacterium]HMX50772.1 response regulator [Cyclobacteriaceae bacterium]